MLKLVRFQLEPYYVNDGDCIEYSPVVYDSMHRIRATYISTGALRLFLINGRRWNFGS
jgi:hypothetical protein